jgi:hypothetical protein
MGLALMAEAAVTDEAATPLEAAVVVNATFSAEDDVTVISFAERWSAYRDQTVAQGEAGLQAFVGDYAADGVAAIVFEISGDGHVPSQFSVRLVNANDSAVPWVTAVTADDAWLDAVQNVESVGIRLVPGSFDAETYKIRNFMLVTKVGKVLFGPYGVTQVAAVGEDGDVDTDGDGQTDLEEDLVGTAKDDASDTFVAEVVGKTEDGLEIKWASAKDYATYEVFRTQDLTAGFGTEPLAAVTLDNVTVADGDSIWEDINADPAGGPYYYKVVAIVE